MDVGLDQAGRDGVHAHAFGRNLAREPEREGVDRRLRGRVPDKFAGRADGGGRRRQIHDGAAPAPVLRRHAFDRFARDQDRAGDVEIDDAANGRGVGGIEAARAADNAGIVDEMGEPAELFVDFRVKAADFVLARDVGLHEERPPSRAYHFRCDLCRRRAVAGVVDRNVVARGRRRACNCGPDAAARAGHEKNSFGRHLRAFAFGFGLVRGLGCSRPANRK